MGVTADAGTPQEHLSARRGGADVVPSVGMPGKPGDPFKEGDWMVRVELDRPKAADALKGQ